jgi:hypothetical protein
MSHRKGDNLGGTKPCTAPNPFTDVENSHIRGEGVERRSCVQERGGWGCVLLLSATRFNPPFAQTALASRSYPNTVFLMRAGMRSHTGTCKNKLWEEYSHNLAQFTLRIKIRLWIDLLVSNISKCSTNFKQNHKCFTWILNVVGKVESYVRIMKTNHWTKLTQDRGKWD